MSLWRPMVLATAVPGVLAMSLTSAQPASAAVPTLTPSASHHYRVHGDGVPPLPSLSRGTMVRAHGDEFVVGQRRATAKNKTYRMVFLVHRHGAHHWTERLRAAASSPDIYKYSTYSAQVSPDGTHVVIEVNSCAKNKLYVIDAPMKKFGASPRVRLAESGDNYTCEFPDAQVKYAPFVGAAALSGRKVTLVFDGVPDPTFSRGGLNDVVAVSTGSVEHGFPAPRALRTPPGGYALPVAVTGDPITGEATVVANSRDGRQGIYAYNKLPSGSWTGPTAISPPLQPTAENRYEGDFGGAVTAAHGHVTAEVCHFPNSSADNGDSGADATCGTVDRDPAGNWGTFAPYPGMTHFDYRRLETTLTVNPKSGSVHLIWAKATSHYGYLRQAVRTDGTWSASRTLLRVQDGVVTDMSVALTSAGHPVVGFRIPGN